MASQQIDERELRRLLQDEAMQLPDMGIVVSGMAGRFPKSDSVGEFEVNLYQGVDMINDQDNSRFTCGLWNLPPRAGRLKDLTRFDCEFFGYTAEEANYIDFQMRILYEVVYESILDAGVNPASLRGTNTGVFFGLHCNEFENAMADDPNFKTNGYYAQFAVKVAQYFDFRGLTVTFDAACASGFVGLHNAVQALDEGIIEQAIVCSSNIPIHPTGSFIFLQMQMLSPTGYSRFLDSRADGYVKSEACVAVLLQRQDVARRNYASFMATMTSVDGFKSEGITFPSDKSQERLIRDAKSLAGISTNHIEYLEAHGTGTPAGDPQEARAISSVYYPQAESTSVEQVEEKTKEEEEGGEKMEEKTVEKVETKPEVAEEVVGEAEAEVAADDEDKRIIGPLLLGSVKTNMGHSEAASGLCALAKVVLMLENEMIYKGLHYAQPNSNIKSLKDGRLKFVEENMELRAKIVPMSCYGFGGSNVHAIVRANPRPAIEAASDAVHDGDKSTPRLVFMFGRTEESLNEMFDQLLDTSSRTTRNCLSDDFLALLDSINSGPIDRLMEYRGYLLLDRSPADAPRALWRSIKRCQLEPVAVESDQGLPVDLGRQIHLQDCRQRHCNLIFPGLGCQWPAMAQGLTEFKPFWDTIQRLVAIMEPFEAEVDLVRLLTQPDEKFTSMSGTFVAIVAYQIALTNIVKDQLKLKQLDKIVGHSLGEIACAYASGVLDEREALMVAYRMGRTLDENRNLIAGKMVAFGCSEAEAEQLISGHQTIRVSCVNGPESVTISGSEQEMDAFCARIKSERPRVSMMPIECPVALHNSSIMGPEIEELLRQAVLVVLFPLADYKMDTQRWVSGISREASQANAEYFAASLCRKVKFTEALEELADDSIVLELGPSGLFEPQLVQVPRGADGLRHSKFHYAKMMRQSTRAEEQVLSLMKNIGQLYQLGGQLDLTHFYHGDRGLEFPLRRQTPSLSSIFRWDHQHHLFVPRYPIQFSKSSAKCEMPVDIVHDRDKYITDHCIEGRVLFPATGYLFLIWRVFSFTKRKIYDACFHEVERELVPIEFHNVRLMRAVILGNRVAQIYIHYEEGTGRFEIKEGGSVVAEGYARSPEVEPRGLLYEDVRRRLRAEQLELVLDADDIYKQFRVSGYDYGESFRNIQAASTDGRYCRVKYNGHFTALTDSILQSIFLAVSQYAPSGGLFLPTRFDYVRFQPEVILKKIHEAKMVFDLSDKSLDTEARRELMTKIMQRSQGDEVAAEKVPAPASVPVPVPVPVAGEEEEKKEEEKAPECIFETYCDPITGVIITDGIEMRGIKASPAPRRSDTSNNEILLESYQFVCDDETPVEDENLTQFQLIIEPYTQICDAMSLELCAKLTGKPVEALTELIQLQPSNPIKGPEIIEAYKSKHLSVLYKVREVKVQRTGDDDDDDAAVSGVANEEEHNYDMKKNGSRMLMSVLDQLCAPGETGPARVRAMVQKNRQLLMRDLIQAPMASERFMRPLVELVIENCCARKSKLTTLEVNIDDGLMKEPLQQIVQSVSPLVSLDYSLAHPEPSRIASHKALAGSQSRTFQLKDLQSLFVDHQMAAQDLIVYKDISCYSLPKQVIEQNGLAPVLSSLNGAVATGGFVLVIMRRSLSLAERILLTFSEPELVGLSQKDLDQLKTNCHSDKCEGASKINHINTILETRYKQMLNEAQRNKMLCVAQKCDQNGCTVLLFRATCGKNPNGGGGGGGGNQTANTNQTSHQEKRNVLLRVAHQDVESIEQWLTQLKELFKPEVKPEEAEKAAEADGEPAEAAKVAEAEREAEVVEEQQLQEAEPEPETVVWLCGVATKESPVNGLVGMMQALSKELGWARLRCYYDCHTFKEQPEPITVQQIEASPRFQLALQRDLCWNCIDSAGNFGAFRHFTINDYMSYEQCLCKNSPPEAGVTPGTCAYVNNATRGDLSSFTWYEAPYRYLDQRDQNNLIRVAYSALNFRDIMLATGRLPLDAIPIRLAMSDCLLGLEFAGRDPAGRRMMGMVFGRGIATHGLCPDEGAIKLEIPDGMSLREAATIPVVYATAIMALKYRGRMQRGESILIHAGSGGVGQAAIRLAAHEGLEIFTTVGTAEKRQFLLEEFPEVLRDDHIFSSRDCHFESAIMAATSGRGVDLVLNSLADDKLQASVRCLADGGRFLEIGKYDMSMDSRFELLQLEHNKTFHGILLDKLFDTDDIGPAFQQQLRRVLATMQDGLAKGYIRPIRSSLFQRHQVEEAFRFMATGKHMGKVLIEIDGSLESGPAPEIGQPRPEVLPATLSCVPRCQISPGKSYIVTGGLGGFGLELTKWLVQQGARHILLTSRTGVKTGYQRSTLHRLTSGGLTRIQVVTSEQADACTREGARTLLDMAWELSPQRQVGAIFHLAMVLKDSLLENMSSQDFERVCRPKISAGLHLDEVSRERKLALDYFVCFSSVTSGKGNAGQANYAYANSCLERLCERRRSMGEHGLAIQWGAIGDVGVAYENLGGNNVVVGGTVPQRMPSCLATLGRILAAPFAVCLSVVPVNRGADGVGGGPGEKGDLVAAIMHVLGIKDSSKVSDQASLGELGLDSLMAVEIRQYIEREYEMTLNIQEIRSLTIAKIRDISANGKPTSAKGSSASGATGAGAVAVAAAAAGQ